MVEQQNYCQQTALNRNLDCPFVKLSELSEMSWQEFTGSARDRDSHIGCELKLINVDAPT